MSTSQDSPPTRDSTLTQARRRRGPRLPDMIYALAVGPQKGSYRIYDEVLEEKGTSLSIAINYVEYWELWTRPVGEIIHVFILCEALARFELEEATRFIRQRWPRARILAVVDGEDFLDDPLYDDHIPPRDLPQVLVAAIKSL
jgi:hypothetical protein